MAEILVLGAGMVGGAIARDLARSHQVSVGDLDEERLRQIAESGIDAMPIDVTDTSSLTRAVAAYDIVIGAVPGFLGYRTLETVIRARKPIVDISFFPEDALGLDDLAREMNSVAIVDAGVAPGLDNLVLGHHDRSMEVERFECLVGGLPMQRKWPFEYKAPFSPIDVIEEYTRPARFVEGGRVVTRAALSDPELVHFDRIGTLESFNTDGLRTLIDTMPHIPDMKEKTLRYPGHIDLVRALQASGFFSQDPLRVNGVEFIPREFTSKVLMNEWRLDPEEPEFTVMRVTVEGKTGDKREIFVYDLYDAYDQKTRTSSMARTTGYTCTAIAELVINGHFSRTGISPLELVGREVGCFGRVVRHLAERNVTLHVSKAKG